MKNPWLDIPLADYEGHMASADVAQARLLADILAEQLQSLRPRSLAVIGCAGGNGFERIDPAVTSRVVGVDLNGQYLEQTRNRYHKSFSALELVQADIQDGVAFDPVELVYAGLILEYVDVEAAFSRLARLLSPGGTLLTVVQLPAPALPAVTPSPYPSLQALASTMRFVAPEFLPEAAKRNGMAQISSSTRQSPAGKRFQVQAFRAR